MKNPLCLFLAGVVAVCVIGCKSMVEVRPSSSELLQRATQFRPPADKAAVYVIRGGGFAASGSPIELHLDQTRFGSIPIYTYLYGEVTPSEHLLELSMRAPAFNPKPLQHRFTAEASRCYFFKASVGVGGFDLEPIEEEEGKRLVGKSTLSGDNRFERLLRGEGGN